MIGRLWTPTGGILYHQRASEHARELWAPYRDALTSWLETWSPPASTLFLFGPSGGYTLNASFLSRFRELRCFDPDPLASVIFRRRFGRALREAGTALRWSGDDLLSDPTLLARELASHPQAAIFFSGLLGQLRSLLDPAADQEEEELAREGRTFDPPADSTLWRSWKAELTDALNDRAWASVHDRVSSDGQANLARLLDDPTARAAAFRVESGDRAEVDRELPDSILRIAFHGTDEIGFHGAEGFLPQRPRRLLLWPITPGRIHLMEAVHQTL